MRTTFVDLDNSLIVDSKQFETSALPDWYQIHRHEQIECNGCFAYVPEEICSHHLSDLNLFSVCQVSFLIIESSHEPTKLIINYCECSWNLIDRLALTGRFEWQPKPRLIAFNTRHRWWRIVGSAWGLFLLQPFNRRATKSIHVCGTTYRAHRTSPWNNQLKLMGTYSAFYSRNIHNCAHLENSL